MTLFVEKKIWSNLLDSPSSATCLSNPGEMIWLTLSWSMLLLTEPTNIISFLNYQCIYCSCIYCLFCLYVSIWRAAAGHWIWLGAEDVAGVACGRARGSVRSQQPAGADLLRSIGNSLFFFSDRPSSPAAPNER